MSNDLFQLYPFPGGRVRLKRLYLDLNLHRLGTTGKPFVYANFLSSLDGRIALEDAKSGKTYLPPQLTTHNDFRLFLELHAQADCLITHGGYLRALANGKLGNILQVGLREDAGYLAEWRIANGLPPQPAIVIASASLDFPMPQSIEKHGQKCYIATVDDADPKRVDAWQKQGVEVVFTGQRKLVGGAPLIQALGRRGYKSIYLIAGPHMLDTMLRDRQIGRFFHSITHQLLGGDAFKTLTPGAELGENGYLKLVSLYYDPTSPENCGQWFSQFQQSLPET
ncbi:riboflavin biosynthesis protein RibD [Candidatus Methylospira mobilis]|uniref:Riboflavin biosynthesis protein RibD n=1 Tax=Candidatus Methylospira mobilis TaxID=1808979 RepID=A0A5Q0BRR2_9GAMM|nr:riboflavin biosynthesis protein RibD [Candidatus Methylospira mobilis]